MALTVKQIEALRPELKRYEVPDGDGLILRVSPSGKKTFCFVYRAGDRVKRLTLGVFPEMSLGKAREKARKARSAKIMGEDPVEAKKWVQETWKSTPTVAEFIDEYLQRWAKPNKKSWQEDQRLLDKDVKPIIGDKKITEVRRRDIIHVLDLVKDRGAIVTANRVFAVISRMFNFALERGVLEASLATRIKMEAEESRDRVLTRPEIKTLHQPCWPPSGLQCQFQTRIGSSLHHRQVVPSPAMPWPRDYEKPRKIQAFPAQPRTISEGQRPPSYPSSGSTAWWWTRS